RLGGSVRGEWARVPAGGADGGAPYPVAVQVHVPLVFADIFLEELGKLGAVPPENAAGRADLPAGDAPDAVLYTVRIRLR
ncbi:MAG TPA: hypothetical protein VE080_00975, partial [Candidatus Aquicultoraceae bacterium]|nr:hypothetical protein [Candidatus Aquicultoraceae bacterium]